MSRKADRKPQRNVPSTKATRGNASPPPFPSNPKADALMVILCLVGLVAMCGAVNQNLGLQIVGIVMLVAIFVGLISGLMLWGKAFEEDFLCGLLFVLPSYNLYYVATRWDRIPVLGTWHVGSLVTFVVMVGCQLALAGDLSSWLFRVWNV